MERFDWTVFYRENIFYFLFFVRVQYSESSLENAPDPLADGRGIIHGRVATSYCLALFAQQEDPRDPRAKDTAIKTDDSRRVVDATRIFLVFFFFMLSRLLFSL